MEKWFFSDNGKVTAPLDLDAAKVYLADKPNVYGWHPSYSQWKPVSCILEFSDIVAPSEQSFLVPKELTEKFLAKKKRLKTKLTSIDDSINHTQSSLNNFQKKIADYKELTKNLNDDVKGAITNIDKKYNSLNKKLSQVKNAVAIAEVEISDAISAFDQRINSNDVFMPSCHHNIPMRPSLNIAESDEALLSKAKLAQAKLATPHKRNDAEKPTESAHAVVTQEKMIGNSQTVAKPTKELTPPNVEYANKMATESINSMKNMMKSVFKGDKKTEQPVQKKSEQKIQIKKQIKEEPLSMAERLKLAQSNA